MGGLPVTTCGEFYELAALSVVGLLDGNQRVQLELYCQVHPEARNELAAFGDAMTAFARTVCPPVIPSSGLKARLMDRIRLTPQLRRGVAADELKPPLSPGFHWIPSSLEGWVNTPIAGLRTKQLAENPGAGYRVVLLELAADCRFPSHSHQRGPEELYVISGNLVTEGRTLCAGDYLHAEAGTDHGELWSPSGCVAMVVEPVRRPHVHA